MKITPPTRSGSFYRNYKGFNSLVLTSEINLKLDTTETVVLSCCVLHNYLCSLCNLYAADVQDESEEKQSDILTPLQRAHNRHAGEEGRAVRENFLL